MFNIYDKIDFDYKSLRFRKDMRVYDREKEQ